MPLTLTIRNADSLENGSPLSLILDRRGAIIGRAPTSDWCLPDPSLHISSRHCEIVFRDESYVLNDISTNGTFLRGSASRLPGPRVIAPGDVFLIGPFEIAAALDDATAAAMAVRNAAPPPPQWQGWDAQGSGGGQPPAPPANLSKWDAVPTGSAISGTGPMSQAWAPPQVETPPAGAGGWGAPPAAPPAAPPPAAAPVPAQPSASPSWDAPVAPPAPSTEASPWGSAPPEASKPASDWSVPVSSSPPASTNDIWGQIAASNVVDWARGGFGAPTPPPNPVVAGPATGGAPSAAFGYQQAQEPAPTAAAAAVAPSVPPPTAGPGASLSALIAAAGLDPSMLKQGEAETLDQAGRVLRLVVAGLVVLMEARARAKSQMGAQGTSLEFDGNNPLKFARAPEQALAQLLNPPERGFMAAERAIEDSFRDLQAHQVATLKAMQGALRATLDRFSPAAIRARADQGGLLKKILPGAKDAALWAAYEREFSGVAQGSDEAFMDVFAKEFRQAYEDAARRK